jgi:predicted secreted Zn-dependent protease
MKIKANSDIKWNFPLAGESDGHFTAGPPGIQVTVKYSLPKWDIPDRITQKERDEWERFTKALEVHEKGHKDVSVQTGYKLLQALKALPAFSSRYDLDLNARAAASPILTEGQQTQQKYDKETRHGATQGAYLLW